LEVVVTALNICR